MAEGDGRGSGVCREIFSGGEEGGVQRPTHVSCVMNISQTRKSMPPRGWYISHKKSLMKTILICRDLPLTPP